MASETRTIICNRVIAHAGAWTVNETLKPAEESEAGENLSGARRPMHGRRRWPLPAVIVALAGAAVAASAVKLKGLAEWRYTSDLFTFDQMLQQTLHGRFGLEYTYGNQFGDHAWLTMLALLPVKAVAGARMASILLLLGPLTFALGVLAFFITSEATDAVAAAAASLIMLLYLGFGEGLLETIYGFAPDIIGGFAALTMAAALEATLERRRTIGRGAGGLFIVAALVFILTKEEMALLAILFFSVLAMDRRIGLWRSSAVRWLAVSAGVLVGDLVLIRICQSPWNRTDLALIRGLIHRAFSGQLTLLLASAGARPYVAFVAGSVLCFATVCMLAGRVQPVAQALAAMGFAQLAFSLSVSDFDLTTWHNYPGVTMLTGAMLIQWRAARAPGVASRKRALAGLFVYAALLVELSAMAMVNGPRLWQKWRTDTARRAVVTVWNGEISALQSHIGRSNVVSIEPETAAAWTDGFRIAFFPRGVSMSPAGIADYVVLSKRSAAASRLPEFEMISSTSTFVLYRRIALAPPSRSWRRRFVERYGAGAIGAGP